MADENSELKITILPEEAANLEAAAGETVKTEVKDPALQELMAQYKELETKSQEADRRAQEAETRRREAERQAAQHRDEAETARKAQTSSHLDTITTAISASEQDVESAKQAIRSAKATGDVDAEIEAQDRLAKARATLLRLDEAKQDIEARAKAPKPKAAAPSDPVEAFVQGRTKPTADWIRAHPQYVQSEQGMRKLTAADAVAQDQGHLPDTLEYFEAVEQYLGLKKAEPVVDQKQAPTEAAQVTTQQTKPRSAAPPVAPGAPSGNGSASSSGGREVTLTAREAAAATDGTLVWNWNDPNGKFKKGDPIGVTEFAKRKLQGMKAGLYDRSFTES